MMLAALPAFAAALATFGLRAAGSTTPSLRSAMVAASAAAPALRAPTSPARTALSARQFPRTWVPLASTHELEPERPTPVRFLGQRYVCWRDNSGVWRVNDDACPHRLAPLSEGRIDRPTGTLECAYHGWAFAPDGSCERIPQAASQTLQTAIGNPRSCVTSYDTREVKSVLWVWPWAEEPDSVRDAEATPEFMLRHVQEGAYTYTRDFPLRRRAHAGSSVNTMLTRTCGTHAGGHTPAFGN